MGFWGRFFVATLVIAVPIGWLVVGRLAARPIEPRRLVTPRTPQQVAAAANAAIGVRGWSLIDADNPVVFRSPVWRGSVQEIAVLSLRSQFGTIVVVGPVRYLRRGGDLVPACSGSVQRRLNRFEALLTSAGSPGATSSAPWPPVSAPGVGFSNGVGSANAPPYAAHCRYPRPQRPAPSLSDSAPRPCITRPTGSKPQAIRNAVIDAVDATPGWQLLVVDDWEIHFGVRPRVPYPGWPGRSVTVVVGECEANGGYALAAGARPRRVGVDQGLLALGRIERRLRAGMRRGGIVFGHDTVGAPFPGLNRLAHELDAELRGGAHGDGPDSGVR